MVRVGGQQMTNCGDIGNGPPDEGSAHNISTQPREGEIRWLDVSISNSGSGCIIEDISPPNRCSRKSGKGKGFGPRQTLLSVGSRQQHAKKASGPSFSTFRLHVGRQFPGKADQ